MSSKHNDYKPQTQVPTQQYSQEENILCGISEIVTDESVIQYGIPKLPAQQYSSNKHLNELQDQEPYNRRESFLHDLNHEPYWQNERGLGHHPFQTPKHSTSNDTKSNGFFIHNPVDSNAKKSKPNHQSMHLHDPSYSTSNPSVTDNPFPSSNNTSQEMAIIEEHNITHTQPMDLNAQQSSDIYCNDDTPNHNGRITTFARNGQINPISLYKLEYEENDEDLENDSYEDSHSDMDEIHNKLSSNNNKQQHFLNTNIEKNAKKKVSFASTMSDEHKNHSNVSSASSGPHSLMQSGDALQIPMDHDVMAITSPSGNQRNSGIFKYTEHFSTVVTPQTAPTSPLQKHKKFTFSPEVSNIKNQRHSVVSIAMIQKIREDNKRSLHKRNSTSHEMDSSEEMENFSSTNSHVANHETPYIERSGTENDILTDCTQHNAKNGKMKKFRNSPPEKHGQKTRYTHVKNKKSRSKQLGWQKKAHSYRPQSERYTAHASSSDSLYTVQIPPNDHHHFVQSPNPLKDGNIPITRLKRTQSDLTKNRLGRNKHFENSKVPPATSIIQQHDHYEKKSNVSSFYSTSPQSLSISKADLVKERNDKIDIENLIPLTVSRYISHIASKTGNFKLTPPRRWNFDTVAMFADVSGFTKLGECLANAGAGGAEKLAFYLNRYLEQLANKARKEGGDVFKFAGDAIIIVWPPDFDEGKLDDKRIAVQIARAVQAARGIQNEFHNMEIIKGAITLSVKIGIGYGPSSLLFVGGQFNRIEYLMCGSALKQAFDCESYANPGDVIISKQAYKYVQDKYVFAKPIFSDKAEVAAPKAQKLSDIGNSLKRNLSAGKQNGPNNTQSKDNTSDSHSKRHTKKKEPVVYRVNLKHKDFQRVHSKALKLNNRYLINDYLKPFVPNAAWQRLKLRYKPWHGEQRAVTVLFINLDFNAYAHHYDTDYQPHRANLENMPAELLQKAVKTIQKCIYQYKGSLNKFLFDDKGSTVIAVFGLPPIANFDDCTRAVLAALLIEQKMKALHIKARIGVTTGRVYIGVVGAAGSASEYGILGAQVNLAARLMQHAIKKQEKGGLGGEGVVVSDTTYAQAKECINIDWQRLQSTLVKGFSKEFLIWRPHWRKIEGDLSMKRNRFFIGWKETMDIIKTKLLKLTKSTDKSRGYVVAIHADRWGGSTQFARQLLHEIHNQIYVVGTTNLAFNDEKLFSWKALLARIVRECRLLRTNSNDRFKKCFRRFLTETGGEHLCKYLPVLNELLNIDFESSDESINHLLPELDNANSNDAYSNFGHKKLKSYTPQKPIAENIKEENERNESLLLEYRVKIIVHLLRQVSRYSTMVILISKFQYMGLADWAITQTMANQIRNGELCDVSMVLAGWSMDTASLTYLISEEEKLIREKWLEIKSLCWLEFVLPKWTKQEVRDFLKAEFDIEKPSKNVLHFIVNKTDGIPGMIKTLVHDQSLLFLKHGGHLDCSQIERCRDIQSGSRYSDINLPIPYAIQSYYTKMLDSLDQFALLTIKCAAVIAVGQEFLSVSFSYDMLFSCHPLRSEMQQKDDENGNDTFAIELHAALSLLKKDRFVYQFRQNKLTQEMIRLSDHKDQNHKHDNDTFYVFASGFLRDVTYGNMLYKQRSSIHKRVKKMLDRPPFNSDELVKNCIRRHHLLSLQDGFYSNRDEVERKREEILAKKSRGTRYKDKHQSIWSFPECVLVLYIQDVTGLPDTLKSASYVTIHVGDDKGKSLTQSASCNNEYMSVVLSESILKQIEDDTVGPVLTMRLWYKQNYRVDKTIGKFTLRLRELYEKQLSEQMLSVQRKSEVQMKASDNSTVGSSGRNSKRNSYPGQFHMADDAFYDNATDLFVGYKMTVHVKQKKINRYHLDSHLYIESFLRFCAVATGAKNPNLQSLSPFASKEVVILD